MNYSVDDAVRLFLPRDAEKKTHKQIFARYSKTKPGIKAYHKAVLSGKLKRWSRTPRGKFALILLYDQAPRVVYKNNDPRIYSTDAKARSILKSLLRNGFEELDPIEQGFALLPFHHSEKLSDQKIANKLFKKIRKSKSVEITEWICRASDLYNGIIKRFRRFPHRNKILGRKSTEEEIQFLKKEW